VVNCRQIKCVKPNSVKKNVFDSKYTLYQLTYRAALVTLIASVL
jgi:myosin heavy subunit